VPATISRLALKRPRILKHSESAWIVSECEKTFKIFLEVAQEPIQHPMEVD